jgi:hypothetical protein
MSYFGIYRDIPDSQSSATIQPQTDFNRQVGTPSPTRSGEFNQSILLQEKSLDASLKNGHDHWQYEHGQRTSLLSDSEDPRFKLRRFLLPVILVVFVTVALGGLLAWSCVSNMPAWGVDLTRRAALEERSMKLSGGELAPLAHDLLNSNRDLFRSIWGNTFRLYWCVSHSCGVLCCILSWVFRRKKNTQSASSFLNLNKDARENLRREALNQNNFELLPVVNNTNAQVQRGRIIADQLVRSTGLPVPV